MSFGSGIIFRTGGQIVVYLFYSTLISVDLAQYEIFSGKVCGFRQGWYKHTERNNKSN